LSDVRWIVVVFALLAFPASALAVDVKEVPVSIAAAQPTDEGDPVSLDGALAYPPPATSSTRSSTVLAGSAIALPTAG